MKKILIVTNIVFFGAAVFFGINWFTERKKGINQIGYADPPCPSKICNDYTDRDASGRVNGFLAHKLFNNYVSDLGKTNIWRDGINTHGRDATSAWFPLERIKQYIWEIERKSCEDTCNDPLGLRVYFAKYPDSTSSLWPRFAELGVPTRYSNHHTIFMVPTFDDPKGVHWDFDPWSGCRVKLRLDSLPPSLVPNIFLLGTGSDAQNHGSLIPPDDPTGSFGGGD